MTMLFSQRDRDVREEATISGMNDGQSLGHACFRIWLSAKQCTTELAGTDLDKNKIELVEVSLFASHFSFILSNVDSSLNNEVSDTWLSA